MHDIAERWNVARRTVERHINDPNDPYPLIARKFGTSVRMHRDDPLIYEEQYILTRKPARKTRKPLIHRAVSV